MQLYPAIDIKDGHCVRLTKGSFDNVKTYSDSPVDMAMQWVNCGATFLHLVDLDGALHGRSVNYDVLKEIAAKVDIPIQVGGGIRTLESIEDLLSIGIKRCIIGTKAVKEPAFIKEVVDRFGAESIVVGIDAKKGYVAIEGWESVADMKAVDLAMQVKDMGVKHIVYTDIDKDGMLSGPNIPATVHMTEITWLDIIASGGVSCMDDLTKLYEAGVHGCIIGKALYEDKIDLSKAIERFE